MPLIPAQFSTASPHTWTGLNTFTKVPTGTGVGQGSVYINPASANANEMLFGVALNGSARFRVDEDGDGTFGGNVTSGGTFLSWGNNGFTRFVRTGNYAEYETGWSDGVRFQAGDGSVAIGGYRVTMGAGCDSQRTLTAHLDQDDVTINRDVDGDTGTYNEAGALLHLHRDVTNTLATAGNFMEWSNDGATPLGYFDAAGQLRLDANQQLGATTGVMFGDGDTGFYEHANNTIGVRISNSIRWLMNSAVLASLTSSAFSITIAAGSATSPVYGFGNDTNTGVGRAAADELSLISGGVEGVRISSGVTKLGAPAGANYAQFAADGELTLFGTARATKNVSFAGGTFGFGASAPTFQKVGNYSTWIYTINDDSVITWELPEDWAVGTDLTLSIDWAIDRAFGDENAEIQWNIGWSAVPHDASEALDAPTHTGTLDPGDQNIPATNKTLTRTAMGTISGASLSAGDEIGLDMIRVALDGGANPGAAQHPYITHLHLEYVVDKLGEAT